MTILATLLFVLTQPLSWVLFLLALSLLASRRPALGRGLVGSAMALLLLLGWKPLPDVLIRQLEAQHREIPPQADLRAYVGMVVLGGSTEPSFVAAAHAHPLLNSAAERMTTPLVMLQKNPHLKLVYTGGGTETGASVIKEAQLAKVFFDSMGVTGANVLYEGASRTTFENATLTAQLPGVDITQRWLLVTSAWHMPRSMATFTKAGWNVTAYPVDFRTGPTTPWTEYSLGPALRSWQMALHEHLGTLAYRITGRL
ncbi:YdcF family protein [Rhodoferax sp. AJA081-3]|uniref:YdcF family protein n=1 Tax=Rhodoferax sp. AJA081-3 TaxID=2752316 RepID=UPI001AE07690|nr:YdcF family protein [Rhodoferax sp. AJA081-3]QTN29841.1 YdcF family protein [Rhodoferax sp. AJA081-3]